MRSDPIDPRSKRSASVLCFAVSLQSKGLTPRPVALRPALAPPRRSAGSPGRLAGLRPCGAASTRIAQGPVMSLGSPGCSVPRSRRPSSRTHVQRSLRTRRRGAHAEWEECGGIAEGSAAGVGRRSAASGLHDRASWHILPMTPKIAVECGPCQLEMSCERIIWQIWSSDS